MLLGWKSVFVFGGSDQIIKLVFYNDDWFFKGESDDGYERHVGMKKWVAKRASHSPKHG